MNAFPFPLRLSGQNLLVGDRKIGRLRLLHQRGKGDAFKKVLSTLLLLVFLFNWFGYRVVISAIENNVNDDQAVQAASNNYDQGKLISVKIPLEYLPYANNNRNFINTNGQVEMNGVQYNYIKWRLLDDTLEFLCVPNMAATKLQKAKVDLFKLANDLQNGGQNKKSDPVSNATKNLLSDCEIIRNLPTFTLYFQYSKRIMESDPDIPRVSPTPIDYPPELIS